VPEALVPRPPPPKAPRPFSAKYRLLIIFYNTRVKPVYRRMISILAQAGVKPEDQRDWNVYIVRCADQTLYTGIAKDVSKRIAQHNAGRGAAYTRTRRPVTMVYAAPGFTRSGALVEEARIKALPRDEKKRLARAAKRAGGPAI